MTIEPRVDPVLPPLVSVVMVTCDRPALLRRALRYYERQTWRNRELVLVVNDPDADVSFVPDRDDVRLVFPPAAMPIGTAINFGIAAAGGEWIQRMDDDDWYHRDTIRASMARLASAPDPRRALTGHWRPLVWIAEDQQLRYFAVPEGEWGKKLGVWSLGCTYAFHRDLWDEKPYRDVERDEDTAFFMDHAFHYVPIERGEMFVYVRHGAGNLSRVPLDYYRTTCPLYPRSIESVMPAEDAAFYRSLAPARQAVSA